MVDLNRTIAAVFAALLLLPFASASFVSSSSFPKETLFFDRLSPHEQQVKLISNPDIAFTQIGITTNATETRARIIVQAMPDCPENAPYQTNVLQCFIVSSSFDGNDVQEALISFDVPSAWLSANGYSSVELRRYSYSWNVNNSAVLSSWKSQETYFEKRDGNRSSFVAHADGIEYFSIVGVHAAPVKKESVQTTQNAQTVATQSDDASQITGNVAYDISGASRSAMSLILIMVVVLALVSAMPHVMGREEQSQFSELVRHIRRSNESEDHIRKQLLQVGWDTWQIDLAFKEAKENR